MQAKIRTAGLRDDSMRAAFRARNLEERQKVKILPETAANFRRKRLWLLNISIFPKFPQSGDFQNRMLDFCKTIFGQEKKNFEKSSPTG